MKGYTETQCIRNELELRAFYRATELVARVSDIPGAMRTGDLRCHELARAVAKRLWDEDEQGPHFDPDLERLNFGVQDGSFGATDHSWIWLGATPTLEEVRIGAVPNLLDVYAVGSLPMVQLIHTAPILGRVRLHSEPGDTRRAYRVSKPGEWRTDIRPQDIHDCVGQWPWIARGRRDGK